MFYLFPLVLVLTNSLKTTGEFTSNPFSLPTVLQWGNYSYAFEQMHFLTSLRNSLVITVCVCALIALLGAWPPTRSAVCGISSFPPSIT
mgnify:CR=1 FL=1